MIRALGVLASTLHGSVMPYDRVRVAGVETLVARPAVGAGPVVVLANAATPRGVDEPFVGRFLGGLAGAGFVAMAPELPGVRDCEVTPATVQALIAVTRAAGSGVALIGVSTGAGLVILAAADPRVADRVSAVASIAPFASLRDILRLATTGHYGDGPFDAAPLVGRAATRSLLATAPDDPAVPVLVANRDPHRFDELFGALAPSTRTLLDELSPVTRIPHVVAPVELASAPDDRYCPVDESRALARAGREVRLTVTPALDHVRPRIRPGLARVVALLDRTLRRAAKAGPSPVLQPSPGL